MRAHKKTTKNLVQCLLLKDTVVRRHSPKICLHKDEGTVVDGLSDTMQKMFKRADCMFYYPTRVESPLAVDPDLSVTAGSGIQTRTSDDAAGSAVTAGSDITSVRGVVPDPYDYHGTEIDLVQVRTLAWGSIHDR